MKGQLVEAAARRASANSSGWANATWQAATSASERVTSLPSGVVTAIFADRRASRAAGSSCMLTYRGPIAIHGTWLTVITSRSLWCAVMTNGNEWVA